jgi:hypothetical protein
MRRLFIMLLSAIVAAACCAAASGSSCAADLLPQRKGASGGNSEMLYKEYAEEVVCLLNRERRAKGLPELKMLPLLCKAADKRAHEIVGSFQHTRPDGRKFSTIFAEYGISDGHFGENIAGGYETPDKVMSGWLASEGHKNNILGDYRYIGVGVVYSGGMMYWSQLFMNNGVDYSEAYLPYIPTVQGDVDGNGLVSAADATMVLKDYASRSSGQGGILNENQMRVADLNKDSMITAVDAAMVLRCYVYLSGGGKKEGLIAWLYS